MNRALSFGIGLLLAAGCSAGDDRANRGPDGAHLGDSGVDDARLSDAPIDVVRADVDAAPDQGLDAQDAQAGFGDATVADQRVEADASARFSCNTMTGLTAPVPLCTEADPCTRPGKELGDKPITDQASAPLCRTTDRRRNAYNDGPPLQRTDENGTLRFVCLYQPEGARISKPRPLVVFLHGGNGSADVIYDHISLRQKAPTFNLSGDPERLGFFLLSIHGRNVHYPTFNPRDGRHHDFYFRDMGSPSTNPDITNVDYWIDTLVATGKVDTKRIYLAGWSNGGYFSQMYAIARHENATPGGARVAAAVAYTAADPFNNINRDQRPSCKLDPYPESTVPLMLVHRSCDIVACDVVQALSFEEAGSEVEPGHIVGPWVRSLAVSVKNPHVRQLIVDTDGEAVNQCRRLGCTPSIGILNHVRWPDGVADRSGIDHEPAMLDFMRAHPLG